MIAVPVLVAGAGGQLGQALKPFLLDAEALFMTSAELDITDLEACKRIVADHGIGVIVNAAAYTQVDKAESEMERAFAVNARGAENLARAAGETGAVVVQVSTDYVFDGDKDSPYCETDPTNPLTVYGRSKLAGEEAVLHYAPAALVVRTGWLYSEYGANFLKTMMRLGAARESLGVVADQIGTPTHASHLARDILRMCEQVQGLRLGGVREVFHYADSGAASWCDFAQLIMRSAGLACDVKPITTAEYPTAAERPGYSVLDKSKIMARFGLEIQPWQADVVATVEAVQAAMRRAA